MAGTLHLLSSRPGPDDVPALVAARGVALGEVLEPGDLEVRMLPPRALPEGALDAVAQASGHSVSVPLARGQVLTGTSVQTSALLSGMPVGTVAVFVPVADAAIARVVAAGDRVDVHSPVDGASVVRAARVLRTGTGEDAGIWLAVDPEEAGRLAAARGADPLGAALLVALHAQQGGD